MEMTVVIWIMVAVLVLMVLRRLGVLILVVAAVLLWWFWPQVSHTVLGVLPWSELLRSLPHVHLSWS